MSEREGTIASRTCPDLGRLIELSRATLTAPEVDELAGHLAHCQDCQQTLRTLDPSEGQTLASDGDLTLKPGATLLLPGATAQVPTAFPTFRAHKVLGKLGQGGMGVVYDAWDLERGARVALKTLPKVDPSSLYRFKREFRARADLVHPNLVSLYELVADGDRWYFTMDRLIGVDLLTYLRKQVATSTNDVGKEAPLTEGHDVGKDPVPSTHADATLGWEASSAQQGSHETNIPTPVRLAPHCLTDVFRQLAEGLITVHDAGLLHRDIKPSNVLVTGEGRVVILDFGLVGEHTEPRDQVAWSELDEESAGLEETRLGAEVAGTRVGGTVDYMAPEQASGLNMGPACDWYSFGIILHEALTGVRPFSGSMASIMMQKLKGEILRPSALVPDLSAEWDDLCHRLLSRSPELRPTGREVLSFFQSGMSGDPPSDVPSPFRGDRAVIRSFVGREPLIASLLEAANESRGDGLVVAMVHGRSGIGKSTAIARFLDRLSDPPHLVLRGRCHEQESVPYKAVDSLIDELARQLRHVPDHELSELLSGDLAPLCRLFPVLEGLVAGGSAEFRAALAIEAVELRRRAFQSFRGLVENLLTRGPLVIAIDDFQWGDVDSSLLLAELFKPPRLAGLLLLISYRSEYADRSASLQSLREQAAHTESAARVVDLPVEPLGPDETRVLINDAIGPSDRLDAVADKIIRESGGNPLFVHELIGQLDSERFAVELASGKRLDLSDVFWWRVETLPEEAKRLLYLVALAGRPVRLRTVYQAADLIGKERAAALALRAGRFVRSTGQRLDDEVEIFHDSLREAIVCRIDPRERSGHHRSLAHALEDDPSTDPETLAVHWIGAGDDQKAGHYYAKAAELALRVLAFERAAKHYQLAESLLDLSGSERVALRKQTAVALANAGRCHEAAMAFDDCARQAVGQADWAEFQRLAAYHFSISGRFDEGRDAFGSILKRVGMRVPRSRLRIIGSILRDELRVNRRGLSYQERAESEIDPALLERFDIIDAARRGLSMIDPFLGNVYQSPCMLLALEMGEPRRLARYLALHASRISAQGSRTHARALTVLSEVECIAERLGDPETQACADLARGLIEFHVADWQASIKALSRAQEFYQGMSQHQAWELATCQMFLNAAYLYAGDLDLLATTHAKQVASAQDRGDLLSLSFLNLVIRPHMLLVKDHPESIFEEIRVNRQHWPADEFLLIDYSLLVSQHYVFMYQGRPDEMVKRFNAQWSRLRWSFLLSSQIVRVPSLLQRGMSLASSAGFGGPRSYLKRAERDAQRLDREDLVLARPAASKIRGVISAAQGDRKASIGRFEAALANFEALGMAIEALGCRHALGRLRKGQAGTGEREAVEQELIGRGVRDPARFASMYNGLGFLKD